ncbi:four-carbon acid sugar kinase family protein [Streptomyces kunmingensis]|uniref:3-oxo-tetronate kinase n=1 Tax=Streptomyces kunmingensis TaxID=68225 RepID=A0ABU6CNZ0_9ACTN|nr:3-oxo-tetronate kinase [Streptomyces kunmingensis]MEB3966431.1 four-carbon acid sugar kinase family protein [Streptomyces kunmingensis]
MPLLGAIADDFTGATDLATMLVARGFRTVVAVGSEGLADDGPAAQEVRAADAVVIALKSRTAPVDEAVGTSLAALRALTDAGCESFYFKYCSTFDSTPVGNIGPVTDALLDALGEQATVVVPAFPATGRTVYKARLFVHDDLLEESPMRDHPLTPMRDSHLVRLLAPQTRRPVRVVGLDTVRAGVQALRSALASPEYAAALTVVDATEDQDLRTISAATSSMRLVTGAAGLAVGLTGPHEGTARAAAASRPGDVGAVLAGSASAATRAQVAHGREHLPHRKLDLAALRADPEAAVAELVDFARACWRADPERPPLLYAVGSLDDLEHQPPEGAVPAAELVERALAECAVGLVRAGARRLLVAGGETSGAVVTALGARTLGIGAQIAPGVAWARTHTGVDGRAESVDLALKSGNFGGTSIFTSAWEHLA